MLIIAPSSKLLDKLCRSVFFCTIFTEDLIWMINCLLNGEEEKLEDHFSWDRNFTSKQTDDAFNLLNDFLSSHQVINNEQYEYVVKSRGSKLIFTVSANKYLKRIAVLEADVKRLVEELDYYERLDMT